MGVGVKRFSHLFCTCFQQVSTWGDEGESDNLVHNHVEDEGIGRHACV